jgi:hypothetical protein
MRGIILAVGVPGVAIDTKWFIAEGLRFIALYEIGFRGIDFPVLSTRSISER